MFTKVEFEGLLKRNESATLDFKENMYDFDKNNARNEFIKDVICMANTPRTETSYIVLGVRWTPENGSTLIGLSGQVEGNLFVEKLGTDRVSPVPKILYQQLVYEGKKVGILEIPIDKTGPFLPTKTYGDNHLRENQLYIRRSA